MVFPAPNLLGRTDMARAGRMADLLLYGHPDSGHACKVALALSLAGLSHRTQWIDMWAPAATRPADFLAVSPFAEVPVLLIDGRPLVQSGAILLEIAHRFQCLGGDTPEGLQRARELMMWEANRIGMCLPQLKEARRVNGEGYPAGAIIWLTNRWLVDRQRFGQWLGDAAFSMATDRASGTVRSGAMSSGCPRRVSSQRPRWPRGLRGCARSLA